MKKSNENRLYLLKRLFCLQLKSGMSISSHIDEFNKLIVDLLNLDEAFKDECKAMLLIVLFLMSWLIFVLPLFMGRKN